MIQLASLSKSFGDRVLLEDVAWHIGRRERVGLCGPNGAGKTTLLRMLAGMDEPDKGEILKPTSLTVGYLPQDGLDHSGRALLDEAMLAFESVLAMKAELHDLEGRLGDTSVSEADHDALLARYSELQDRFRAADGYSLDLKVATVLRGLGFAQEDFDRPTETFSGGWQMRIALAKLLLGRPTLLLLDEPTNHLDLEARNWLEEYLAEYPHSVILVSHDRFFLDAVVTRITEIGLRALTDYPGNYSGYLKERDERLERLRDAKRRQDEEVARVKAFIDRFRYQATKASQVQSRIKMLEKVVPIEIPPERKRVHFTFPACAKSGRSAIELLQASKRYGDKVVFRSVDLLIERGDRLALVGPNGAGKSTLMRLLSGVEPPDTGSRAEGHQVVSQYFAQDEAARLDPTLTVYRDARKRVADQPRPGDSQYSRRVSLLRRRRLQKGRRAVGRRANASGGGADAPPAVEYPAPGRAHEPPRPRLQGRAARGAGGFRRHADLRFARPVLRRSPGHEDCRGRRRRNPRLPRHLRGVPVE